ncbi:hypothetical protein VCUG_02136 [Vavraia culicis subsp. floridensis]|uniref:Uncharacterized protein n=1 Tax=Vavraia culicis (isolate floridensis) TaxID=948595 RepID=L2GSQ6_VAVCU|nr:uncharacterized protein VCUG_02136 [Vavraia culicis subsp. floridensis]ELA46372.1 hypothetical protein VCUG_02136 [Vavraia culicis subsp. floridensis]
MTFKTGLVTKQIFLITRTSKRINKKRVSNERRTSTPPGNSATPFLQGAPFQSVGLLPPALVKNANKIYLLFQGMLPHPPFLPFSARFASQRFNLSVLVLN